MEEVGSRSPMDGDAGLGAQALAGPRTRELRTVRAACNAREPGGKSIRPFPDEVAAASRRSEGEKAQESR
jgi:hypothetical protein